MEGLVLFLLFLLGRNKPAAPGAVSTVVKSTVAPMTAALPPPGVTVFADAWKKRCVDLLKRSKGGDRWVPLLTSALGGNASVGVAAARWVGIESGGKTTTTTSLGEYGLAQGMKENYSAADWTAVRSKSTTDEQHAQIAVRLILSSTKKALGTVDGSIGMGKLYHALPLMVKELRDQKLLKTSVGETLAMMLASYKPSAKVASYVKGKHAITGNVQQDIALRFFAPAAVVSYGEASIGLLDTLASGGRS